MSAIECKADIAKSPVMRACCERPRKRYAAKSYEFRLAILIAIGHFSGGHAHWIITNDSTPQHHGL
jgi:hypothetical protein